MLKYFGIGLIVVGAVLIFEIPLLGWVFGGLLVFIGISLWAISRGRGVMKAFMPKSVKVCPDCKAPIPGDASVCMHCGHKFTEPAAA